MNHNKSKSQLPRGSSNRMAYVNGQLDHLRETTFASKAKTKYNHQLQRTLLALLITVRSLHFKTNNESSPLFSHYLVLVQKYLHRNKEVRDKVKAPK